MSVRPGSWRAGLVTALDAVAVRRALWWATVVWVVVFWRLGDLSLLDPDEAHYAEITREMIAARQWLMPLLGGEPFIDKPVVFHWLQAAAFAVFGPAEIGARMPSALAAVGLFALTRWTGRVLFDDGETGADAELMLATLPLTFALASLGIFDMVFTLALFGALACLAVAAVRARPRLQWAGFGLLALATTIKGPVALGLAGLAFVLAVAVSREARRRLQTLHWLAGPLLAVVAASPWFVWMWIRFGDAFVDQYFVHGNVWYLTHPGRRRTEHLFYLRALLTACLPWSLLVVGRAIDWLVALRRRTATMDVPETLAWAWIVAVFGLFSVSRFKLDYYIYPAMPAMCLLAARAWRAAGDRDAITNTNTWQRVGVVAMPALLIGFSVVFGLTMFSLDLRLSPFAVVAPIATGLAGLALAREVWREGFRPPAAITSVLAAMLILFGSVGVFGFPVLERSRPTPAVARWIHDHVDPAEPIGLFKQARWQASLRFYSMRQVKLLESQSALRLFLAGGPGRHVVMLQDDFQQLVALGDPVEVVFRREAVTGTTGSGLRRQRWRHVVVVAPTR